MSRSNPRRHAGRAIAHAELLETRRLLAGGPDRLVNNNLGSTTSSHFTQAGAVLVAFGNTVVTAFNDSGSLAGGANKFTGFARSANGGGSFTDGGTLPTHPLGDAGFPAIARDDTTGRIYLATVAFTSNQPIQVFRSDTGGSSWAAPVNAMPPGTTEDKPWVTVDNFAGGGRGNVYVVSRRLSGTQGIYLVRSTDGGTTYGAPVTVTSILPAHGAFVTVGPDHAVYVFWWADTTIQMRKSTDMGQTFAPAITVASGLMGAAVGSTNGDLGLTGVRNGTVPPGAAFRTNEFPQVAVNPVNGNLYVTYANNPAGTDKADIFLVQSSTGGASWSSPARVNDDATTTDQWFPTIAVSPDGTKLGVFYYSRQEDPTDNNLFRYYSRVATLSGTSTTTFTASSPVSDVASRPEFGRDTVVNGVFVGEYNQAVATNDFFHVVWSDNRSDLLGGSPRKDPNVFYDKIPLVAAAAPVVTASNFNFATLPQRLSFTFDQDVTPSISIEDLVVQQLPAGPTFVPNGIGYNFVTNTVTYQFGTPLPDGRFRARLIAGGITNSAGTPMAADHVFEFTFLRGDANGDARVNLQDFNILAGHFGQTPRDFTQGDFNYDNTVNLQDFNILAGRFGVSVAPSAGSRVDPFGRVPPDEAEDKNDLLA